MAIVKLKDPSVKTPIDLGSDVIKRREGMTYISRKPRSRWKHRGVVAQKKG